MREMGMRLSLPVFKPDEKEVSYEYSIASLPLNLRN